MYNFTWYFSIFTFLLRHNINIFIFSLWLSLTWKRCRNMFIWWLPLHFFVLSVRGWFSEIFYKLLPNLGWYFPFSPTWVGTLSSLCLSTSGAQRGFDRAPFKLIMFFKVELLFSWVLSVLRVLPFERANIAFVGRKVSDKGNVCGFCLRGVGAVYQVYFNC